FSLFFFSSRRRHTRSTRDWSSDVCSSDLRTTLQGPRATILASDALAPAARVARLALPTRAPKASLATLVGAEAGSQVTTVFDGRSEERRVGKGGRARWGHGHDNEQRRMSA